MPELDLERIVAHAWWQQRRRGGCYRCRARSDRDRNGWRRLHPRAERIASLSIALGQDVRQLDLDGPLPEIPFNIMFPYLPSGLDFRASALGILLQRQR